MGRARSRHWERALRGPWRSRLGGGVVPCGAGGFDGEAAGVGRATVSTVVPGVSDL
ncbi:hypothetical protein V5P93_004017 [Actinokineospora auranticolor]|uniref:hypothetical protein n=1 Tax=Actinokineospora auranticolor TaxID=155976 RepID=UPI0015E2CD58|nr:hypothetical protein [Actinokineospora auranticolor]